MRSLEGLASAFCSANVNIQTNPKDPSSGGALKKGAEMMLTLYKLNQILKISPKRNALRFDVRRHFERPSEFAADNVMPVFL